MQLMLKLVLFITMLLFTTQLSATDNDSLSHRDVAQQLDEIEKLVVSDIAQARKLAKTVAATLAKHPNSSQQATLHNIIAYAHILSREFDPAYKQLVLSRKHALEANDLYALAESKRLEGVLYSLTNLPEESLSLFLEALTLHKQLNSQREWHVLQGISLYYRSQENFAKYLEYGQLLISHPLVNTAPKYLGTAEYTVGEGLVKLGRYDEAKPHLLNSIRVLNSISSAWVSEAYISLAELQLLTDNPQKALETVLVSKVIATENRYFAAQVQADLLKARIYQALGDNNKAIAILDSLLPEATQHKDQAGQQQAHQMLAALYEQKGALKSALFHHKEFKRISDSIALRREKAKSTFHRARLDFEHQEQKIELLKNQKERQAIELEQKQRNSQLRDMVLGLSLLLLILMLYYAVRARKVKRQMQKLAFDAETANKAKSNFLAKMSHEIRTPMNAIIGLSQLTLKGKMTEKQRENVAMVHASSQSLLTLLNDILDFSKIEAQKLELERAEFLLSDSMNRLLDVCSFSAQEKLLNLDIIIDSDVPSAFVGDALRLEQVLINLVNNAIKFTEKGDITIRVSLLAQEEHITHLKFSVSDHGIGIAKEQLGRLFKAFSQSDNSMTRRYGGTGLGLVICKELVELMSGEINVESELGKGSCFSFNVELEKSKQISPVDSSLDTSDLSDLKVLIVDDSMTSRTLLLDMLENINIDAHQAQGGVQALEMLKLAIAKQEPFDVVLMDWRMPGLDGFESIRIINQVISDNLPRFILISSFDKNEAVEQSRETPVADILEKPVKSAQLIASLNKLARPAESSRPSKIEPSLSKRPNSAHLNLLLAEDNLINQRVIRGFLEDLNITIDAVENGLQAVKAVENKNYDIILMDVQMPKMDGLTATKMIRQELDSNIPIIAMTAHSTKQDSEKSFAAGMNMHLTKPVDVKLLTSVVEDLMKEKATEL